MELMVMAIIFLGLSGTVMVVNMSFKKNEALSMFRDLLFKFDVYDLNSAETAIVQDF